LSPKQAKVVEIRGTKGTKPYRVVPECPFPCTGLTVPSFYCIITESGSDDLDSGLCDRKNLEGFERVDRRTRSNGIHHPGSFKAFFLGRCVMDYLEKILIIKDLEETLEETKEDQKNILDRRRKIELEIEGIRDTIFKSLKESGQKEIDCDRFKIGYYFSYSVKIEDIEKIPLDFVKITKEPKKLELKKAIESGGSFPGVFMEKNEALKISKI
jgi:hypothetical protein